MGRAVLASLLLALSALSASAEQAVTVKLQHRSARDAATLVAKLLSPDGTVLVQPRTNSITVTDSPEIIGRVTSALARWDLAPRSYRITVRVVVASTADLPPGAPRPKLSGLEVELSQLFHFTSFELLDELRLVATDGSSVAATAGGRYSLRFTLRANAQTPERVQLVQLEIGRHAAESSSLDTLKPLLRTSVSLQVGQTGVVAAAPSETASRVLLLVMRAEEEDQL